MFTPQQAIEAIKARISGEWDNDQLIKLGPLNTDTLEDIKEILNETQENNELKDVLQALIDELPASGTINLLRARRVIRDYIKK